MLLTIPGVDAEPDLAVDADGGRWRYCHLRCCWLPLDSPDPPGVESDPVGRFPRELVRA